MPNGYFLKSARLAFRCWTSDDLPFATEIWGDPQVTALIGGPFTAEMVRARLMAEIDQMAKFGVQYWPIFLSEGDQFVGCAGLRPYRVEQGVYELGFHLCRAFWKRGLGYEAARAVIDYAFAKVGATSLFAGHHPANKASGELLKKLGFVYTHEEFYEPMGLMHPSYILRRA